MLPLLRRSRTNFLISLSDAGRSLTPRPFRPFAGRRRRARPRRDPFPSKSPFFRGTACRSKCCNSPLRRRAARAFAPDEALLAEGLVSEDVFYQALAKHLNVDFVDSPVDVAPSGVATAECGYARVRDPSSGFLWLFAPSGSGVFRLMSARRAAKGRPLFAITTRTRFLEAVRRADPANAARDAAFLVERVDRDLCARGGLRRGQVGLLLIALIGLAASLYAPFFFLRLASAL
ncbi:MAG: glycosyl transferase family 2, partial [Methylocystis sp.]